MTDELLTPKELAFVLKRNVTYVYAMRRRGFAMVCYRTTLKAALEWLLRNPQPRGHERKPADKYGRLPHKTTR